MRLRIAYNDILIELADETWPRWEWTSGKIELLPGEKFVTVDKHAAMHEASNQIRGKLKITHEYSTSFDVIAELQAPNPPQWLFKIDDVCLRSGPDGTIAPDELSDFVKRVGQLFEGIVARGTARIG